MLSLSPPEFLGAKICFWIAGLAALIWWLTYDAKPHVTLDKFASARKKYILLHWGGALTIIALATTVTFWVQRRSTLWELAEHKGWLRPGNLPAPKVSCMDQDNPLLKDLPKAIHLKGILPGEVALYFGSNVAWTHQTPFTVLEVRDKPMLIVDKDKHGNIALTLDVFDDGNPPKIIASIVKNAIIVNVNNSLDFQRTNNSLLVRDQERRTVLSVDYLNASAIRLSAILNYPDLGGHPISIGDDVLEFNGGKFSNGCFGEFSLAAMSIFPIHHRYGVGWV